jgi:hypothetical protein
MPLGIIVSQTSTISGNTYESYYKYVIAGEAITIGRWCNETFDIPYEIEMGYDAVSAALNTGQSGGGIAMTAFADATYGWVLVEGVWVDASTHVTRSNAGTVEHLQAVAATGVLSDAAISDNAGNVGIYTIDDIAIVFPMGSRGAHAS